MILTTKGTPTEYMGATTIGGVIKFKNQENYNQNYDAFVKIFNQMVSKTLEL